MWTIKYHYGAADCSSEWVFKKGVEGAQYDVGKANPKLLMLDNASSQHS